MADGSVTDEQVHAWLQQLVTSSWVSIHYDNPALGADDQMEIAGGGYSRIQLAWSQPANRTVWSLVDARWTGLVQTKVTHFGLYSAKTQGILRAYAELREPQSVMSGKGVILPARTIAISFA